jgi:hypothetical protein
MIPKSGYRFSEKIMLKEQNQCERVTALGAEFIRDLFAQFRPVMVRRMFSSPPGRLTAV